MWWITTTIRAALRIVRSAAAVRTDLADDLGLDRGHRAVGTDDLAHDVRPVDACRRSRASRRRSAAGAA